MAMLRVSYQEPNGKGRYLGFFVNFIDDVEYVRGGNIVDAVSAKLESEYSARMIREKSGFMYVEFPTEADITLFLLRWS
jgi:hypothetical protein